MSNCFKIDYLVRMGASDGAKQNSIDAEKENLMVKMMNSDKDPNEEEGWICLDQSGSRSYRGKGFVLLRTDLINLIRNARGRKVAAAGPPVDLQPVAFSGRGW